MKSKSSTMALSRNILPGYNVSDYMIILNPAEALREKLNGIRSAFNAKYHVTPPATRPNLLLASFTQYNMMEERIINRLDRIATAYYPFRVELKDFGSFPNHTIFVNVVNKHPIQQLVKSIRAEIQPLMKFDKEHKPYFTAEPHMTIAKRLQPWQFDKAWVEYSQKHFTGRFVSDEMLLLKRPEGEKAWLVVKHFKFQNMAISVKQGDLFAI